MPTLTDHDGVHVRHLGNGENRFTPAGGGRIDDDRPALRWRRCRDVRHRRRHRHEDAVTSAAADLLRPLQGKDPGILGAIKHTMFGRVAQALTNDQKALN